ncbi:hypothetical protein C7974DRAFT_185472 [Boeremia exigua]|uniref:uncharacterized protein n=1 Tax=Boeremia exigua TaxID=749465 RepID=UPI001E8DC3D4|nr:uncharacterized protein C7974DRAFT_185472 [Boeremia exigua]KAH6629387.1 hypothetical protein C7974DRAFT_185472 [Boeremia exigua]
MTIETIYIAGPTVTRDSPETIEVALPPITETVHVTTTISDLSTILQSLTVIERIPTTLFITQTRVENAVLLSTTTDLISITSTSTIFVDAGDVITSTTTLIHPTTFTVFEPAILTMNHYVYETITQYKTISETRSIRDIITQTETLYYPLPTTIIEFSTIYEPVQTSNILPPQPATMFEVSTISYHIPCPATAIPSTITIKPIQTLVVTSALPAVQTITATKPFVQISRATVTLRHTTTIFSAKLFYTTITELTTWTAPGHHIWTRTIFRPIPEFKTVQALSTRTVALSTSVLLRPTTIYSYRLVPTILTSTRTSLKFIERAVTTTIFTGGTVTTTVTTKLVDSPIQTRPTRFLPPQILPITVERPSIWPTPAHYPRVRNHWTPTPTPCARQ